jgi:hypothetical protein
MMNDRDRGQSDTNHQDKQTNLNEKHETKSIVNKLFQLIDSDPCQIYAGESQHTHAGETEKSFRFWDASHEFSWADKKVDIEDSPKKYGRSQQMEIAYDESKNPMKCRLKGLSFFKDSIGYGIPITIFDIGKTRDL